MEGTPLGAFCYVIELTNIGQACCCDGLTNAAAAFIGQMDGDLFCQLGELECENLLRVLEEDVSALSGGYAAH